MHSYVVYNAKRSSATTPTELMVAQGSIGVGSLLGVVAFFLIRKNRQFLLGRSIDSSYTDAATRVLQDADIIR